MNKPEIIPEQLKVNVTVYYDVEYIIKENYK